MEQAATNETASSEESSKVIFSKVPELTVVFWMLKITATTLGETGGDTLSMSLNLGYLLSTGIFAVIFLAAVAVQIKAPRFHPVIYWVTIVATTTVGTTLADFFDRSLGIGYPGGAASLLILLLLSIVVWRLAAGTVAVDSVNNTKSEVFYWVTIMFSQTLGTALGDWTADSAGMGYVHSSLLFGGLLLVIAALHYRTKANKTALFWCAFVLTRPLGATLGDFFDKPVAEGGLALSRFTATGILVVFMITCILVFPHRAAKKMH